MQKIPRTPIGLRVSLGHQNRSDGTPPRLQSAEHHQGIAAIVSGADERDDLTARKEVGEELSRRSPRALHESRLWDAQILNGGSVESGGLGGCGHPNPGTPVRPEWRRGHARLNSDSEARTREKLESAGSVREAAYL
jgi:hypothetical protein